MKKSRKSTRLTRYKTKGGGRRSKKCCNTRHKRRKCRAHSSSHKGRGSSSEVYDKKEIARLRKINKEAMKDQEKVMNKAEDFAQRQADRICAAIYKKELEKANAEEYTKILVKHFDFTKKELHNKTVDFLENEVEYRIAETEDIIHNMTNI